MKTVLIDDLDVLYPQTDGNESALSFKDVVCIIPEFFENDNVFRFWVTYKL